MDTPNNVQENSGREKAITRLSELIDRKIESDEDFFAGIEELAYKMSELARQVDQEVTDEMIRFHKNFIRSVVAMIKSVRKELDEIVTLYHS